MEFRTVLEGRAWRYGANVDTDVIIPARYLTSYDPAELGKHCLEDLDPDFASRVRPGDMVVAEENFGSGSSREHAPLALKGCGVSCVIASSFARIFYRNAINVGLPILECPEAVADIRTGDPLRVDLERGTIENLRTGRTFQSTPFPESVRNIIEAGGLVEYVRRKLKEGSK
ncbi:MAG: 3-isopropylmalate dehydratase small subunit [Candidatus Geothermincolales bacterium]